MLSVSHAMARALFKNIWRAEHAVLRLLVSFSFSFFMRTLSFFLTRVRSQKKKTLVCLSINKKC